MPPVATWVMSMWMAGSGEEEEGSGVYWRMVRVTVAREMALRRNQERPWRVRRGSMGSERVWFYIREEVGQLCEAVLGRREAPGEGGWGRVGGFGDVLGEWPAK